MIIENNSIRILIWSSRFAAWIYYHTFSSLKEYESHINQNGFDHRYFKIEE